MKKTLRKAFAVVLAVSLFVGMISRAGAADYVGYSALDQSQPVSFDGKTVKWNGKTFTLDENTLFLDYRLDRAKLAGNPYAFNTLKDAAKALKNGTAEKPMMLLTAPGVYWVDDPDDPAIRGNGGAAPVGMTIACNHLYFYGLNTKWENVVFAVNRGQTQGSAGNFTMFKIQGTGLKSENVTFGNYCNVDLKFPLNPSLSRAKRADAIAQAQLFSYNGGDGVAINSAFVSRLNLLPFARTYLNCHIESSGHAGGQQRLHRLHAGVLRDQLLRGQVLPELRYLPQALPGRHSRPVNPPVRLCGWHRCRRRRGGHPFPPQSGDDR